MSQALDRGAYDEAEGLASEWSTDAKTTYGPESLESARASDLVVRALIANGKYSASDAVRAAEAAVRLKERLLGPDHPELSISLHNLGRLRRLRGESTSALALHERGLSVTRRSVSLDDPRLADSLDALALELVVLDKLDAAAERLNESLEIREKKAAESPFALARTLELRGRVQRQAGRYAESAATLDRVLQLWDQSPLHPDRTSALELRAFVHYLAGEIPASRRIAGDALALARRTLRRDHPVIAMVQQRLALAEEALGDLVAARRLREQAFESAASSLTPCAFAAAGYMNDLANSLQQDAEYTATKRLRERQLAERETCLGLDNSLVAGDTYNLFDTLWRMGAMTEAEPLGYRAVRLWTAALGASHPFVAFGLSDLAEFETERKRYGIAARMFERALGIRRKTLGDRHPDVALTRTEFARMLGQSGDVLRAQKEVAEAIDILRQNPSRTAQGLANALRVRAGLERRTGHYVAARADLREALIEAERIFSGNAPLPAAMRAEVASVELALGSNDAALAMGLSTEQAGRDLVRFTVRTLPERRAMDFIAARPRGLDIVLSVLAGGHPADAAPVLDSVIRSRGVVLDELAARTRPTTTADPDLRALTDTLSSARQRVASLTLRTLSGGSVDSAMLDEARREKEAAEEALAERSAAARTELTHANAGLDDVRRTMPAGSALVSFVRYERTTFSKTGARTRERIVPAYIALVTRADNPSPTAVPLGTAAALDAAIALWRTEASGKSIAAGVAATEAERAYRLAGARLRARLWDPIAPHLAGANLIFIVPDGAINLVSFAALPTARGGYLVETDQVIHYLSTERDLIADLRAPAGRGLLALGGAAYGARPSSATAVNRGACGPRGPLTFDDLPGTREELQDIARVWNARAGLKADAPDTGAPGDVEPLTMLRGSDATKSAVIRESAGRRIVHLATHGFVLDSSCTPGVAGTRAVGGLVAATGRPTAVDNPLLAAGLAFAGANRRAARDVAAAILTAEEAVSLNLQGTEWAVLSACDTGLGEIKSGEGVLGLRRSFQIAGARTVIMSLWSVEDRSTRAWMRALYEGRLQQHLTTADAVRAASLRVLRQRRARGQSAHPFYWAAFVAAGDWR